MMLEIALEIDEEWDSSSSWEPLIRKAAAAAIGESAFPQLNESSRHVELSVRLAGDQQVRELNAHWRGKDKPTNVLSFPMAEESELESAQLLGDIVLAYGVCAAEAEAKGIATEDHAAHLVVHGTLHLLGYDHETSDEDAEEMEEAERRALASIGIADPYELSEVGS